MFLAFTVAGFVIALSGIYFGPPYVSKSKGADVPVESSLMESESIPALVPEQSKTYEVYGQQDEL